MQFDRDLYLTEPEFLRTPTPSSPHNSSASLRDICESLSVMTKVKKVS